jgi:hypothetical protein
VISGRYSKLVVALAGVATSGIETYARAAHWAPAVTAAITAALVFLVPNSGAGPGQ